MRTKNFESADEFLDALSPRGQIFRGRSRGEVLFRGHANADWKLIPSAFRPGVSLRTPKGGWAVVNPAAHTRQRQVELERGTLADFYARADRHGLLIPEDCQALRGYLGFRQTVRCFPDEDAERMIVELVSDHDDWPSVSVLSLMALAQHHGVPTRLLDWTYSAYTAAYFAACDIVTGKESAERLAVLALEASTTEMKTLEDVVNASMGVPKANHRFEVVTASGNGNKNLTAQEGVFVLHRESVRPHHSGLDVAPWEFGLEDGLTKFTLPAARAGELMRLLGAEGVDAARLFPGYDGIRRAQYETACLGFFSPGTAAVAPKAVSKSPDEKPPVSTESKSDEPPPSQ